MLGVSLDLRLSAACLLLPGSPTPLDDGTYRTSSVLFFAHLAFTPRDLGFYEVSGFCFAYSNPTNRRTDESQPAPRIILGALYFKLSCVCFCLVLVLLPEANLLLPLEFIRAYGWPS